MLDVIRDYTYTLAIKIALAEKWGKTFSTLPSH